MYRVTGKAVLGACAERGYTGTRQRDDLCTNQLRDGAGVLAEDGGVEEGHRLPRLVGAAVRRKHYVDVVLAQRIPAVVPVRTWG